MLIMAAGIGLGVGYYSRWRIFNPGKMAERTGPLYRFLVDKWRFDELYDFLLVRPTLWFSRRVLGFDQNVVDGVVNGSATVTRETSRFEGFFDNFAVDGLVKLVGIVVYGLGDWGRSIQTGRLRSYLGVLAVAVVALFVFAFFWIRPR
jgi:NADH-quinone oxidoreductase subunit L